MDEFVNKIICGDWIEVLKSLPDNIFHCCVTSPPYWGQRDYGCEGQLGLEKTPEEHIEKLVKGFRQVRRVLRDDGVLWLNYGDKYSGGSNFQGNAEGTDGVFQRRAKALGDCSGVNYKTDLASGNLLMLPARVALALQADGWILRDDIIWAKAISFNEKYSGSTMPESVSGTSWQRHRIKVKYEHYEAMQQMQTDEEKRAFLLCQNKKKTPRNMQRMLKKSTSGLGKNEEGQSKDKSILSNRGIQTEASAESKGIPTNSSGKGKQKEKRATSLADSGIQETPPSMARNTIGPGISKKMGSNTAGENKKQPESSDSNRMATDKEKPEASLLLLQTEDEKIDARPCNTLEQGGQPRQRECSSGVPELQLQKGGENSDFVLIDCPGCSKCLPNDGLVLRRGSWRCTKAHEHLFQLVKSNDYFCDMEAVREEAQYGYSPTTKGNFAASVGGSHASHTVVRGDGEGGRNLRNVWTINPRGYKEAHYATYPEKLVEPCIKVATSQKGVCPKCGAQWARMVDSKAIKRTRPKEAGGVDSEIGTKGRAGESETKTLGWKATCDCGIKETEPVIVLDPFMGSGTTAVVAARLNRNYLGIEKNPEYKENHKDERVREAETGVPIEEARQGQGALFE